MISSPLFSSFAVLRFESLLGIIHLIAMGKRLAVSVLDLVGMRPGEPAGSAIGRSVDLAQHVEEWGYQRYWLAEHHSIAGLACSATAVLIGHVAAATKTIRVGSGGVMLPNHAPLVVAEQFGTLEALYPGRIDLGLGRAPGGDFATMRALRRDLHQSGDDFPALLEELRTYLGPEKPGQAVKAIPGQGSNVPITLLGSSGFSAQLAAMLGLPFAFAAHFAPEYLYVAAQMYRERFQPSAVLSRPHLMVGVQVIAAETDAAARRLFTTPAAAFSAIDPQSAGGVATSGRFHGTAVAGVGAGGGGVQAGRGHCGIGRNGEGRDRKADHGYRRRRAHRGDGHLRTCGPVAVLPTRICSRQQGRGRDLGACGRLNVRVLHPLFHLPFAAPPTAQAIE